VDLGQPSNPWGAWVSQSAAFQGVPLTDPQRERIAQGLAVLASQAGFELPRSAA
jgi:hypothetical protein